jgi:hypothetical protein
MSRAKRFIESQYILIRFRSPPNFTTRHANAADLKFPCQAQQARLGFRSKAALESYTCCYLCFPKLAHMRATPCDNLRKRVLDQTAHLKYRDHRGRLLCRGVIARPAARQRCCRLANSTKLVVTDDNARSAGTLPEQVPREELLLILEPPYQCGKQCEHEEFRPSRADA